MAVRHSDAGHFFLVQQDEQNDHSDAAKADLRAPHSDMG